MTPRDRADVPPVVYRRLGIIAASTMLPWAVASAACPPATTIVRSLENIDVDLQRAQLEMLRRQRDLGFPQYQPTSDDPVECASIQQLQRAIDRFERNGLSHADVSELNLSEVRESMWSSTLGLVKCRASTPPATEGTCVPEVDDEGYPKIECTAFLVDRDVAVTAAHCLFECEQTIPPVGRRAVGCGVVNTFLDSDPRLGRLARGERIPQISTVYATNDHIADSWRDWAVFGISPVLASSNAVQLADQRMERKRGVRRGGFVLEYGTANAARYTEIEYQILPLTRTKPPYVEVTPDLPKGASGGPVFDRVTGQAVGVIARKGSAAKRHIAMFTSSDVEKAVSSARQLRAAEATLLIHRGSRDLLVRRAEDLYLLGDTELATSMFRAATRRFPNDVDVVFRHAYALFEHFKRFRGSIDEALDVLQGVIDREIGVDQQTTARAHYNLACYCAFAQCDVDRAFDHLIAAVEMSPARYAWTFHSDVDLTTLQGQDRWNDVAQAAQQAVAASSVEQWTQEYRPSTQANSQDPSRAANEARKAAEHPTDNLLRLAALKRALEAAPGNVEYQRLFAQAARAAAERTDIPASGKTGLRALADAFGGPSGAITTGRD